MHLYFNMLEILLKRHISNSKIKFISYVGFGFCPTISMLGNAYVQLNKKQIKKRNHVCYNFFLIYQ